MISEGAAIDGAWRFRDGEWLRCVFAEQAANAIRPIEMITSRRAARSHRGCIAPMPAIEVIIP
jgi:hypothetical protein